MNTEPLRILVTGGAGFIGSAVCRALVDMPNMSVVNIDRLTYAANLKSLEAVRNNNRYAFVRADICDQEAMEAVFVQYNPTGVIHLAAESHVDRSISGPGAFVNTNVVGTYTLLEAANRHYARLSVDQKA